MLSLVEAKHLGLIAGGHVKQGEILQSLRSFRMTDKASGRLPALFQNDHVGPVMLSLVEAKHLGSIASGHVKQCEILQSLRSFRMTGCASE